MQVTLTPHGEELLRVALARHPEQSPMEILEQALAARVAGEPVTPLSARLPEPKRISHEEFEAALNRMAQFSDKIPAMPGETFSRDMIYQDRD